MLAPDNFANGLRKAFGKPTDNWRSAVEFQYLCNSDLCLAVVLVEVGRCCGGCSTRILSSYREDRQPLEAVWAFGLSPRRVVYGQLEG